MKRLTVLLALLLCTATAFSQIKVEAPSLVGVNEQFNISFIFSEKPSDFSWTPGDNFQLVWGPQTGSSTSISIVNGKTTKTSQYTFTYVLLPKSTGSFTLPAAKAEVNGSQMSSKAPTIEVVSDGASSQSSSASSSSSQQQQSSRAQEATQSSGKDLFMRFTLSRTNVVVGEPINATLKLFTRGNNIAGFEDAKFPTFNGFWAQETDSPQSIEFQRENIGNAIYNTAVLRRWVIIPQKSGTINIDPAELICLVQERYSRGNSIFDGFFDDYQTIRKRVVSDAFKVTVSPLPGGAPASFTGAVGKYDIKASISSDSLKVHDAASVTVTISGKGNVSLVGAPKISFPPDSEVYDTKTTDNVDKNAGGTSGSKVFEYPFIPRSHGDFEIPEIEFSYYDINARKYVTVRTPALPYHVQKGNSTDYVPQQGISVPSAGGKDVKNLSEDIHFISTKMPSLSSGTVFFVGTALFWTIVFVILVAGVVAYFLISRLRKQKADVVLVRTKKASKLASKRLALAQSYMAKNLYSAFFEELHKALLGYASDKLAIAVADLTKENIADAFRSAGAPEALSSEYSDLLDLCEFARYAPDSDGSAMKDAYDKAITVISTIDGNMKKTSSRKAAMPIILLLMMLMPSSYLRAQSTEYPDSLWNSAVSAYSAEDYSSALSSFRTLEAAGFASAGLYSNIANAEYKSGNLPAAILYYEKALKLDPSYKDASYNLSICKARCQDRIEQVPEFFLTTWTRKICYSFPSNTWAAMSLILLAIAVILALLWLLSRSSAPRKTGFFGMIAAVVLCIACFLNAAVQKSEYQTKDSAIVMRPVCPAKSSPASSGADLFVLHEGTKVLILDTVGDWTNISIADGREGWVLSSEIEVI